MTTKLFKFDKAAVGAEGGGGVQQHILSVFMRVQ